jgi:hypothetical protein
MADSYRLQTRHRYIYKKRKVSVILVVVINVSHMRDFFTISRSGLQVLREDQAMKNEHLNEQAAWRACEKRSEAYPRLPNRLSWCAK